MGVTQESGRENMNVLTVDELRLEMIKNKKKYIGQPLLTKDGKILIVRNITESGIQAEELVKAEEPVAM